MNEILPTDWQRATLVGRIWRPDINGPSIVKLIDGKIVDITSNRTPTMSALIELENPLEYVRATSGEYVCDLEELLMHTNIDSSVEFPSLLSPADLQAIKACGVTFCRSMVERVIEERAGGDPEKADTIRERIGGAIKASLVDVEPGSPQAQALKEALIAEELWSQYLEVGIGPDAEVFTKSQPMSSVGWGAEIGLHPNSVWNNPEPELVLAVNSSGKMQGATLGNDVNLRDFEGRSALLLGKAKDNNASAALGPFVRLFDEHYSRDDILNAEITLTIEGIDGFKMSGACPMSEISRKPLDLIRQTIGRHHQYPDGLFLYLGTLFAPTTDRDEEGGGFTHKLGDRVEIREERLGALVNKVNLSTACPEWIFGTGALMKNLASRNLI